LIPRARARLGMAARSNAVALVTGGTRGIGRGISEALAVQGFDLLLGYGSNLEAASAAAEELQSKHGVKVAIIGGDVAEAATIAKYFEVLDDKFGGQTLQAVVHNAGQYLGKTAANCEGIEDGAPRTFGALLGEDGSVDLAYMRYYHRIYAEAWVQLVERAVPRLPDVHGSIVGISSPGCNSTMQPSFSYDMPGSAKTVMETSARYYAKNLAPRRITVNVVIPGFTDSDAWKAMAKGYGKGDDMCQQVAETRCPMGYANTTRNLGDVVAFLCGPHSRYITGVALPVDGGLHLGPPVDTGKGKGKGKGGDSDDAKGT